MKYLFFTLIIIFNFFCSNHNKASNTNKSNGEQVRSNENKLESTIPKTTKANLISELTNPEKDIIQSLVVDKCKGKVVYFDIWATWCRPCLAEVPYSKTLQSKFAGKNIAFVNLCCASELANWERTVTDLEIPGEHHLLSKEQGAYMQEKYGLTSFPTYMIFDKKGKLIDENAPRPSSNEIEEILIGQIEK